MRTPIAVIVTALVAVSTSLAAIGDTKDKVCAAIKAVGGEFAYMPAKDEKPPAIVAHYPRGDTVALFFLNSKGDVMMEGGSFNQMPTQGQVAHILEADYNQKFKVTSIDGGIVQLESADGNIKGALCLVAPYFILEVAVKELSEEYFGLMTEVLKAGVDSHLPKPTATPDTDTRIRIKYYPPPTPAPSV